jgi:hypothetical protein
MNSSAPRLRPGNSPLNLATNTSGFDLNNHSLQATSTDKLKLRAQRIRILPSQLEELRLPTQPLDKSKKKTHTIRSVGRGNSMRLENFNHLTNSSWRTDRIESNSGQQLVILREKLKNKVLSKQLIASKEGTQDSQQNGFGPLEQITKEEFLKYTERIEDFSSKNLLADGGFGVLVDLVKKIQLPNFSADISASVVQMHGMISEYSLVKKV